MLSAMWERPNPSEGLIKSMYYGFGDLKLRVVVAYSPCVVIICMFSREVTR